MEILCRLFALLALFQPHQITAKDQPRAATPELVDVRDVFEGSETNQCGHFALAFCTALLDKSDVQVQTTQCLKIADAEKGATLGELAMAAERLGMNTMAVQWSGQPAAPSGAPAILPVMRKDVPHYIVLAGVKSGQYFIVDFPGGGWLTLDDLRRHYQWNGYALYCAESPWSLTEIAFHVYRRQILLGIAITISLIVIGARWRRTRKSAEIRVPTPLASLGRMVLLACLAASAGGCQRDQTTGDLSSSIRLEPENLTLSVSDSASVDGICKATLTIVNESRHPLTIREVVGSCQCTSIELPQNSSLGAGEKVNLPVSVRMPEYGEINATVKATVEIDGTRHQLASVIVAKGLPQPVPHLLDCPHEVELRWTGEGPVTASFNIRTVEQAGSSEWIQAINAFPRIPASELKGPPTKNSKTLTRMPSDGFTPTKFA